MISTIKYGVKEFCQKKDLSDPTKAIEIIEGDLDNKLDLIFKQPDNHHRNPKGYKIGIGFGYEINPKLLKPTF